MTTRRATADDVDGIRAVAGDSWRTDYPEILGDGAVESGFEEWYDHDSVESAVGADDELLYVAERDGEVVGVAHAVLDHDGAVGHLLRLYVHPNVRGEGIGGELLATMRDALFGRGVERVTAMVLAANDAGNEFYRTFGFDRVDEAETTVAGETYPENRYVLERT